MHMKTVKGRIYSTCIVEDRYDEKRTPCVVTMDGLDAHVGATTHTGIRRSYVALSSTIVSGMTGQSASASAVEANLADQNNASRYLVAMFRAIIRGQSARSAASELAHLVGSEWSCQLKSDLFRVSKVLGFAWKHRSACTYCILLYLPPRNLIAAR